VQDWDTDYDGPHKDNEDEEPVGFSGDSGVGYVDF
jgi:hypothetical protein